MVLWTNFLRMRCSVIMLAKIINYLETSADVDGYLTALGGGDGMGEGLKGWWEDLTWMLGGNDTADKVRDRVGDGNLNDLLTEGAGKKRGANEGGGNHEKVKR
nr:MAG TPA: hypothetical protein [Herelleviridae sp.]